MTYESVIIPVLTFLLGVVVSLLWKDSGHGSRLTKLETRLGTADLGVIQSELAGLKVTILTMGIVDLAADVRIMKNSIIFQPSFQRELQLICAERQEKKT